MKTLARARDKEEILRRLGTVRPDSPRRWGRMTAPQMICHLTDAFLAVIGERPMSQAQSLLGRSVIKWIALYAPMRWPPGIRTRPEIDPLAAGTAPSTFEADVARLRAVVDRVTSGEVPGPWGEHPYFGPLSARAWLRWGYLHVDHHLRQFGA